MSESSYRTWSVSRARPLRLDFYPASHPIHVTILTFRQRPVFDSARLAAIVFRILRSHERTLAAVLMPDHLHWLLDCAERAPRAVSDFKSFSTRLAWDHDFPGRLWQRSYSDHVLRDEQGLRETIGYILANPVRAGLSADVSAYRWSYDRFGLGGQ